jgi:hypothetical protein
MLHGMIAVQAINQVSVAHRARLTRRLPDKGQLRGPGWRRPCRARPADRSPVAEDRAPEASAAGRDRDLYGARLVHVWSTCHRNRAVAAVSSGSSFAQVAGAILGKQGRVENPDKEEVHTNTNTSGPVHSVMSAALLGCAGPQCASHLSQPPLRGPGGRR